VAETTAPLLSICVPTHNGRRASLAALLDGVLEQAGQVPGLFEVCIGDNASHDGTTELIERISRDAPLRVAYTRHPGDLGLARNLMSTVELARGQYCWLMGSDDLFAPGALRRACELLARDPGAPGYAVGALSVDARDPTTRSRALARAFHPAGEEARTFEGLDEVLDECGNSWCALSWSIVKRQAWLASADEHRDLALAHPVFPQVVILAGIAMSEPRWGWLAEPLVLQRNATTFLFEHGEVPLADRWSEIIGGAASAWAAVLGSRWGGRWRRRMRGLNLVWGGLADVRGAKLYDRAPVRSQARLAATCLRAFWPVRSYWRDVLGASLMPRWLSLLRYAPDSHSRLATAAPDAASVSLVGSVPHRLQAGGAVEVTVTLENRGRRSVREAGPGAVTVGQRWFARDGRCLSATELGLNEVAALPQSLPLRARPSQSLEVGLTLYPPPKPGAYRVELVSHNQQVGWLDEFNERALIGADVEVTMARAGEQLGPRSSAATGSG
jgi:glycosyltransferase involved in cell wall biosynthesis